MDGRYVSQNALLDTIQGNCVTCEKHYVMYTYTTYTTYLRSILIRKRHHKFENSSFVEPTVREYDTMPLLHVVSIRDYVHMMDRVIHVVLAVVSLHIIQFRTYVVTHHTDSTIPPET